LLLIKDDLTSDFATAGVFSAVSASSSSAFFFRAGLIIFAGGFINLFYLVSSSTIGFFISVFVVTFAVLFKIGAAFTSFAF